MRAIEHGDAVAAERHFDQSARICPDAWVALAGKDKDDKQYAAAFQKLELAQKYATRTSTRAHILNNMGMLLDRMGRRAEARRCFEAGLVFDRRDANLLVNQAQALLWKNDVDAALRWFDKAQRQAPRSGHIAFQKSLALLVKGDYLGGWSLYENRFQSEGTQLRRLQLPIPEWRNQPLRGKRILLAAEQGAGDTVMMLRYVPSMLKQGATVTLCLQNGFKELLREVWPDVEVVESTDRVGTLHDYWAHLMSLPWITRTTLDNIPPAEWLPRWSSPGNPVKKVGICWAGSLSHSNDRHRSTDWPQWLDLVQTPGVEFHSLQVGERSVESLLLPGVIDRTPEVKSFADTVRLLRELDEVITVDTALAHVCGSMGMPCRVLLPFSPDFRWLLNRPDSPWYPSLSLCRQPAEGDWESVFRTLHEQAAV